MSYKHKQSHFQKESCEGRVAFGQVVVELNQPKGPTGTPPTSMDVKVELNPYAPLCGIKSADFVKVIQQTVIGECLAFKLKVAFDDCYFACGYPPLVLTSTCAVDDHTYNAEVRNICSTSNGQHAFFRVSLFEQGGTTTCVPTCEAGVLSDFGEVRFNIYAIQGDDCVPKGYGKAKCCNKGYGH